MYKAIEKLLSQLCQWKSRDRTDALATLAMKSVINSTLKECEWDENEYCDHGNSITEGINSSSQDDNNEEHGDAVSGSSLPFPGPMCLIPAVPILRLLSAILSHTARQEALATLATEIKQFAKSDANFKDNIRANDIVSWLLG